MWSDQTMGHQGWSTNCYRPSQHDSNNLKVETDAAVATQLISDHHNHLHPLSSLISACRFLLQGINSTHTSHVCREANTSVDVLTKTAICLDRGLNTLRTAPNVVLFQVQEDAAGSHTHGLLVHTPNFMLCSISPSPETSKCYTNDKLHQTSGAT